MWSAVRAWESQVSIPFPIPLDLFSVLPKGTCLFTCVFLIDLFIINSFCFCGDGDLFISPP